MTSSAFGQILVLVVAVSWSNLNSKRIEKMMFSAFGKILVLVVGFSFQILIRNVLKN